MKFVHCPHCGDKLLQKEIGDEGLVPFCSICNRPIFDLPYTCALSLVINEYDEIALIKQNYVSQNDYGCVAGYIKSGESAEETAAREIEEEIGITPLSVRYIKSYYYAKRDMLMLGFCAKVKKAEFVLSKEVDSAEWFDSETALKKLREASIALQLLQDYMHQNL